MNLLICPGVHAPELTQQFLVGAQLPLAPEKILVIPGEQLPVWSGVAVLDFLQHRLDRQEPLVLIGFSAGVVGAIVAAQGWQAQGGKVAGMFALDGWGVPLYGDFPIYRLSHDYFTYWSSAILGEGLDSFYADPPVDHLCFWRSPQTTQGWWLSPQRPYERKFTTATSFITVLLQSLLGTL